MVNQLLDCFEDGGGKLERLRYFDNMLLSADDMSADQEYFRLKLRRHNRFLHGWGVVCGLEVGRPPAPSSPWEVEIAPGYALGPFGDEIYVPRAVRLDLADCGPGAATDPCDPGLLRTPAAAIGGEVFVAVRYAECVTRPIRVLSDGCTCEEEACEYSRVRDSFQIECLGELPPSHQPPPGPSLCDVVNGLALFECPPCADEPWVVLAQVTLPAEPSTELADGSIDNFTFRRQVFSTAVLQEQLIECCCRDRPQPEGADLEVAKSIVSATSDGSTRVVRFQILVTNLGPAVAQDIVVSDTVSVTAGSLVAAFDFTPEPLWTQTTLPPPPPPSSAQFEANIASLAPGQVATLAFTVQARLPQGSLTNTASATSATPDPVPGNNSATVTEVFDTSPQEADVEIRKSSTVMEPTDQIVPVRFTVVVINHGPGVARNVQVVDSDDNIQDARIAQVTDLRGLAIQPDELDFVIADAGDGAQITAVYNTIPPSESAIFEYVIELTEVDPNANRPGIGWTAIVQAETEDPNLDNNGAQGFTEVPSPPLP